MWSTTIYVLVAAILVLNVRGLPLAFHVRLMYSLVRLTRVCRVVECARVDVVATAMLRSHTPSVLVYVCTMYAAVARFAAGEAGITG